MTLKDKNILVTGSSRGIGKVIALELAKQGANICIHYKYSEKEARELVNTIYQEHKVSVFAVQASLESTEAIQNLFNSIKSEWQTLDGIILNAATGNRKKLLEQTQGDWDQISHVNILSPIECIRESLPLFKNKTGKIVLLSSEGARFGIQHYGPIGVTKAALEAVMRQLTVELKNTNISINTVSATLVRTHALDAVTQGQMNIFRDAYFIDPLDIA
ncbi:MAG: SDR family oxidoreductase, partial [Bdellovibrio sp.]|nr:SDR family oxidoreductase [Bdellovibrio sp.]